ncbi:MAG: adenylate kinase [Ilumatobacteraceae bacterium]|nr:adenylate kinase [Ilumatobacteraceae bacterium]
MIGRRVIVTGLAGSGKSTLALAIASKTGLPVIHLDLHYWKPDWLAPSETEWRKVQREVLAGDSWIADGNYPETLDLRLDHADTVVLLDLPWWVCSARALRRGFRMPGELPPGCEYTRWMRLRDEWGLAVRVGRKDRTQPEQERAILSQHGSRVTTYELRSKREVTDFMQALTLSSAPPDRFEPGANAEP